MVSESPRRPGVSAPDISILIVSFNTSHILRECLQSVYAAKGALNLQIIVVDNNSQDSSLAMVRAEFPSVSVLDSDTNLGFGGANNLGFEIVKGRYTILLNSDAFLQTGTLLTSVMKMDGDPRVGLAGGRLVGRDGSVQPSARMFPSLTRHLLVMSGLADRYSTSKFFGQADRTWADPMVDAAVDWVPGAYSIIRTDLLQRLGVFDRRFFLYYEEVDLCSRIKKEGYKVMYWPQIVVVHVGGESSRQVKTLELSQSGAQLVLWRMRSTLLYYRKHHGSGAFFVMILERLWYAARALKNRFHAGAAAKVQSDSQRNLGRLMRRAWRETSGGRVSPPQPW